MTSKGGTVLPQNLIRAHGDAGDSRGHAQAAAVDFGSEKRPGNDHIPLFLSRRTRRQLDASVRDCAERTADGLFERSGWAVVAQGRALALHR